MIRSPRFLLEPGVEMRTLEVHPVLNRPTLCAYLEDLRCGNLFSRTTAVFVPQSTVR
jgi:hypothetical protein